MEVVNAASPRYLAQSSMMRFEVMRLLRPYVGAMRASMQLSLVTRVNAVARLMERLA